MIFSGNKFLFRHELSKRKIHENIAQDIYKSNIHFSTLGISTYLYSIAISNNSNSGQQAHHFPEVRIFLILRKIAKLV